MFDWISHNFWFMLFFVWGLPLGYYRSKFRKIVYQTDSWLINIKPLFLKEIKALFGNIYPENKNYLRFRNFYLFYLMVYAVLFLLYLSFNVQNNNKEKMNKIEVGSKVPLFSLDDQNGEVFNLEDVLGKKNLVIYFYPKDDSPGCTKEACSFRDQFEVFEEADAIVIGINPQSVESHFEFAKKHRLNYTLLSDSSNEVKRLFGVKGDLFGLIPARITFVIDKTGQVVYTFDSQLQATKHVDESLRILKNLK